MHRSILVALLDLQLLLLDVERLGHTGRCLATGASGTSGSLFLPSCTAFAACFSLISSFTLGTALGSFNDSIALVLHGNVEENFFVEGIIYLKIDL